MVLDEKERIIIPDEDGEEHLFEVLFTFDVDETEKSYLAVIPVEQADLDTEDEEVDVYAFRYEIKDDENDLALFPIDSDEEWDMVEEMLHTIAEEKELE